jgi:nucleoside-diphosphate-sugar epimerase
VSSGSVLITGAAGFIGRHVVRDQLERGCRVRALDQHGTGLEEFKSQRDIEVIIGDIASPAIQREAVAEVDVVFHLASAHLETSLPEAAYRRINVAAVETLLEHSRRAGVHRFVHVSSCGVHGNLNGELGDEDAPFNADIAYERTKLAGELAAREFARRRKFPVVIARPVWVYGPGCHRTARLFRAVASGHFVMVGKGQNLRSAIYITDFVDALERCARHPDVGGEVFIFTHPELTTLGQIIGEVARIAGVSPPRLHLPVWLAWVLAIALETSAGVFGVHAPISRRTLKFFTNDAGFSCAKAQRLLGFEPRVPLSTGLERTYEWWREGAYG